MTLDHYNRQVEAATYPAQVRFMLRAAAFAIAAVAAFCLGLEMGSAETNTKWERAHASVLVGTGCEGADPGAMVLMSEEDGWGMPCREITREKVSILGLQNT